MLVVHAVLPPERLLRLDERIATYRIRVLAPLALKEREIHVGNHELAGVGYNLDIEKELQLVAQVVVVEDEVLPLVPLAIAGGKAIAGAMAAMDEFMVSFNARDPEAWAASLNYPHVRFTSGRVTVWESAEEFAMGRSFENLARIGWDHSHWLSREVTLASPEKVHIETVFQRWNDRTEMIGEW